MIPLPPIAARGGRRSGGRDAPRLKRIELIDDSAPIGPCVLDRDLRCLLINER